MGTPSGWPVASGLDQVRQQEDDDGRDDRQEGQVAGRLAAASPAGEPEPSKNRQADDDPREQQPADAEHRHAGKLGGNVEQGGSHVSKCDQWSAV